MNLVEMKIILIFLYCSDKEKMLFKISFSKPFSILLWINKRIKFLEYGL